jgi:hypothetical protein
MADLSMQSMSKVALAAMEIMEKGIKRVDVDKEISVYKVPSNNPQKYTIRIDMKFNESEEK